MCGPCHMACSSLLSSVHPLNGIPSQQCSSRQPNGLYESWLPWHTPLAETSVIFEALAPTTPTP
jgi:hypothetical protein